MKYSVIIPVYNSMRYLETCVESVLAQNTDSMYEIILVDDGSKDGSAQLCDRLAETHACVRTIHQTNQGVSAARNTGIRTAAGEYLLFLDADDLWNENLLQNMDLATASYPDVVQFGVLAFFEDGHNEQIMPAPAIDGETGKDYLSRILDQGIMLIGSSCINAHRKDFLMEHDLYFPVGVTFGEDMLFRMRELDKAQSVWGVNEALYLYRRNTESATRNMSCKKMQDIIEVVAELYRQYPKAAVADFYCMSLVGIAELSRKEAKSLSLLLRQNSNILSNVRGTRPQIARTLFRLFGVYNGAKLVNLLIKIKNR